jgi:hypothetical protein
MYLMVAKQSIGEQFFPLQICLQNKAGYKGQLQMRKHVRFDRNVLN